MKNGWSLPTRYYILTIVLLLIGFLVWQTREIFNPLVIAGLIAYFLNPIVNALSLPGDHLGYVANLCL